MAELVTKTDFNQAIAVLNQRIDTQTALLDQKIEAQTLRLTVRLGLLMAAGIAVLGAIVKLT
jgi:hypothetical protein